MSKKKRKKNKNKKKVRVAFRKNREKRTRESNLTQRFLEDEGSADELSFEERLSGKGELSRHRTIIESDEETADGTPRIDVDEAKCLQGRVIQSAGLNSFVQAEDGTHYECAVRGVVRSLARDQRNAVVAGDRVLFQPVGEDQGVIERVEPRQGVLTRGTQRQQQVIVANIDQVLIVVSADNPPLKPHLVDRFLISAEQGEVGAVICINKVDLVDPAELQPLVGIYSRLGYSVVLTSAETGAGLAHLRSLLKGKQSVLGGQSGVGKSSLLNALQPELGLHTAEVSRDSSKGRHTTRSAVLLELNFGGWVVDTPGIRQMTLWDVIPEEVEGFFVEFRPFVTLCKFPDCTHTHEADCGIKQAVRRGLISIMRYESYLKIVTDEDALKTT